MRRLWMAGVCVSLFACGEQPEPRDSEDLLVLELGGDNEPLSRALLRLRGTPPAPPPAAAAAAASEAGEVAPASPAVTPPPPAQREEVAEVFSVYLRQGETLYGLARTHLGSGARWRELLELNGWTEAQAGQLPVGAMVKIPIR